MYACVPHTNLNVDKYQPNFVLIFLVENNHYGSKTLLQSLVMGMDGNEKFKTFEKGWY